MSQTQGVILRIDQVGSFQLILSDQVVVGGAGSCEKGVIKIMAPLSSCHARIRRQTGGYSIEPLRGPVEMKTGSSQNPDSQLLISESYFGNGKQAMLTPEIGLELEVVSPLSQSAKLTVTPAHRLAQGVDGVILMESMVLLGPGKTNHITCSHWEQTGALIYRDGEFRFCIPVGVDDQERQRIDEKLNRNQHYCFEEIGFYLEG